MRLAMVVLFATGCQTFHDLWFNAEDHAPSRDSVGGNDDDCSWFDDAQNCWNTTAAVASQCVPDSGRIGTLVPVKNKDTGTPDTYLSCAYLPSNPSFDFVVEFHAPISMPFSEPTLDFTVKAPQDATCASVSFIGATEFAFQVESAGIFERTEGKTAPEWTCPDGTSITPTFSEVVGCNQGESHMPTISVTGSDREISATVNGLAGDSLQLFHCMLEEKDTGKD